VAFRLADWCSDTRIDGNVFEDSISIAYFCANRVDSPTEHDSLAPRGDFLFISDFIVVGRRRRSGIGRMMYEKLEQEARKRGIRMIWHQPQSKSEGFWGKMGFTYRPAGIGASPEMEKVL
jgi:GNAT superfamily N-acetyltransferase